MIPWNQRVSTYVDEMEQLAQTIDLILDETRLNNTAVSEKSLDQSTLHLKESLGKLEKMVTRREDLLHAADAPSTGGTLTAKLESTLNIEDARLADRCGQVSQAIKLTNERAIALFVCQYHLSALTSDIVKTLIGTTATATYSRDGTADSSASNMSGGGLFDKAG